MKFAHSPHQSTPAGQGVEPWLWIGTTHQFLLPHPFLSLHPEQNHSSRVRRAQTAGASKGCCRNPLYSQVLPEAKFYLLCTERLLMEDSKGTADARFLGAWHNHLYVRVRAHLKHCCGSFGPSRASDEPALPIAFNKA